MNDKLKQIKESDLTIEEWLKMRVTEEYEKALMNKIDKLQSNWNSLREWLEENYKDTQDIWYIKIINKMNELEGNESNGK